MGKAGNFNWQLGVSGNPGGRSKELAQQQSAAGLESASHASEVIGYLLEVLYCGPKMRAPLPWRCNHI